MVRVREEKSVTRYPQPVEEGDVEVLANALYIKPDGRTVRFVSPSAPSLPAHADFVNGVASRDVDVDSENGLWARIFVPESVAKKGPDAKAPVLVFFHGGGFALGSPDFSIFDVHADHCEAAARISEVVVISMSYRLAPEHRLPAAYEDAFSAILWLQKQVLLRHKWGGTSWL